MENILKFKYIVKLVLRYEVIVRNVCIKEVVKIIYLIVCF